MGWKNIKEHYRIKHIVQCEKDRIIIGSQFVNELITIRPNGSLSWGSLGRSTNVDLERYYREMEADPTKLAELYNTPDSFQTLLPVYTYDGAEIIMKGCEAYGWPNITHDGCLMYGNMFSADQAQVVEWAKHNADLGVESWSEHVKEAQERLEKCLKRLAEEKANRAKLEADYPSQGDRKAGA